MVLETLEITSIDLVALSKVTLSSRKSLTSLTEAGAVEMLRSLVVVVRLNPHVRQWTEYTEEVQGMEVVLALQS